MQMDTQQHEFWTNVVNPRFSELYEVSNRGQVRSLDRIVRQRNRWGEFDRLYRGKVLNPIITGTGYHQVGLYRNNRISCAYVHRLVLEAFAGPCPEGMEALHGPGGSLDNRWPENLRWGTHADNMGPDKKRDGTLPDVRNENHPQAKLSWDLAEEIRARCAAGESRRSVATSLGISCATVSRVINGIAWRKAA